MTLVRGINILDLITDLPPEARGFLPSDVAAFFELLQITNHQSMTSGAHYVHHGLLQSATDAGLNLPRGFPLEIPGLNTGVRFQFSSTRETVDVAAGQNLEPSPSGWQLDLFLDRLAVPIPGLTPATRVPSAPSQPAHLVRETGRTRVKLYGKGVLRISGGDNGTDVRLIADPDPFAPTDPIGTVIELRMVPPHTLFMDNGFGMTVGTVTVDATDEFTPSEIVARGHGPEWRGFGVSEAAVYLPRDLPAVGDFSLGVRDMLIGTSDPGGVQLEAHLEFGETATDTNALQFFQELNGQVTGVTFSTGPAANRKVTLNAQTGATARVRARLNPAANAHWHRPGDRAWDTGSDTGWFTVRMDNNDDVLRFRDISQNAEGNSVAGQEIVFRFEKGSGVPTHAPWIQATVGTDSWDNATFLGGSAEALGNPTFTAIANGSGAAIVAAEVRWQFEHDGSTSTGTGNTFTPGVSLQPGEHTLTLIHTTPKSGSNPKVILKRRLRVEVIEEGRLVVGLHGSLPQQVDPATGVASDLTPSQVVASHQLRSFHDDNELDACGSAATLSGGNLTIPADVLAEVALELGTPGEPDAPSTAEVRPVSHIRVYMAFDDTTIIGWRQIHANRVGASTTVVDPWGPAPHYPRFNGGSEVLDDTGDGRQSSNIASLRSWAKNLHADNAGTKFVVIGHCCDLGSESHNQDLGARRAVAGRALLIDVSSDGNHLPAADVWARGENVANSTPTGAMPADPTGFSEPGRTLAERTAQRWRIKHHYYSGGRPSAWGNTRPIPERIESRCVDIYAILPVASPVGGQASDDNSEGPGRRRALVPGDDHNAVVEFEPAETNLAYRFEVRAKWDSPTWVDSRDSIPVLVQLTFDWTNAPMALPVTPAEVTGGGLSNGNIKPVDPKTGVSPDNYRVIARFTFDPRSGEAVFGLALDSPGDANGLAQFSGTGDAVQIFATALAIGPALMGGVTSTDAETAAVRLSALISAVLVASVFDVVKEGKVVLHRIEVEHLQRDLGNLSGSRTRVLFDYAVELHCESALFGVQTAKPFKIRYKNVGLEFDDDPAKSGLEKFNIVYEQASFEIEDAGKWTINGWLGKLLGVTAIRLGTGSIWFEIDLELALDLGVVEVSSATIRIKIDGGSVTVDLRGLAATIDIPGTIKGSGALQVGEGGDVSASLDITIIPAEIRAYAGLVMKDGMTHLEAGVRFATAIPLAGTGFGIYGFMGRFVSNGTRNLTGLSVTDPVERELAWYALPIVGTPGKYKPKQGQYAIGFGAVVGTMPDAGFTFNAEGMLAIEFPDPSVVFTIDASLFSKASDSAKEQHDDSGTDYSLSLLGVIAISGEGLGLGIRGKFEVPRVLVAEIPISAWFPFQSGSTAGYLRVGSDGFGGRAGSPIKVTVLPEILDLKAWTYFMIEEKQLLDLGGKTDPIWDFHGFSIGMGSGFGFKWGGSAIYVEISASFLAGLGTRPFRLTAGVNVKGEIWLLIVGLGISAELVLSITEDDWVLKGEICGKVSFFFFSVKGCVDFAIGNTPTLPPPPAEPLVTGVSLVDKFARTVGTLLDEDVSTTLGSENLAWPDTTLVIHFAHTVKAGLASDSVQPATPNAWGSDWNGTARLKYLYRLVRVRLLDASGNPVSLDDADGVARPANEWPSEWWMPAYRNALPETDEPPSGEHEGWDLAVLKWDPVPWARNLPKGGEGLSSDPAEVLPRSCDEAPVVRGHCVFGELGERLNPERIKLYGSDNGSMPFPSTFTVRGLEGVGNIGAVLISQIAALYGLPFVPGAKVDLPAPYSHPAHNPDLEQAWRLPYLVKNGRLAMSLGFTGTYDPQIIDQASLTLAVCLDLPRLEGKHEVCVTFERIQPDQNLGSSVTVDDVKFVDGGGFLQSSDVMPFDTQDGVSELKFSSKGMDIVFPEIASKVVVTGGFTDDRTPVRVYARDASGAIIGESQGTALPNTIQVYTIEAEGIHSLTVWGGNNTGVIQKVCYTTGRDIDITEWAKYIFHWMIKGVKDRIIAPVVQGRDESGEWFQWSPAFEDMDINEKQACLFLRYQPDKSATWSDIQILPWPLMKVGIVSACGISIVGWTAGEEAEDTREDLQDAINDAVNGDQDDRVMLLDANTVYRVEVEYDWAVWEHSDDQPTPPAASLFDWDSPPDSTSVTSGVTQTFGFRTSAENTIADTNLLTFDDQENFEPRALVRYLHGFDPDGIRPLHLLGDLLWVHFDVEWVETLLDRYGYDLKLRVVRTDPPPPPPGTSLGDLEAVISSINWTSLPLHMQNLADIRLGLALIDAPCLDGPIPNGGSAGLDVELEPRAEYDFIVEAVSQSDSSVVKDIARSHFKTSRYNGVRNLIDATGFTVMQIGGMILLDSRPNPLYPFDFVGTGAAPSGTELGSDAALDEALTTLGMDPWPLPDQPGAVLIWRDDGGTWRLEGILLDSDESLTRPAREEDPIPLSDVNPPERMTVQKAVVNGTNFVPRRSNEAGTRVLLLPGSGLDLSSASDPLVIRLDVLDRNIPIRAERYATRLPHIVYQEES